MRYRTQVPTSPPLHIEHFGEVLRAHKLGHTLTRNFYALPDRVPKQRIRRELVSDEFWVGTAWSYRDDEHSRHSDAYLLFQRDLALRNFDLSMSYFEALNSAEFASALQLVLAKARSLKAVDRLSDWDGASGVYVMVFDAYKQFYIGQSRDIARRIREHWTKSKKFDRLVHGSPYRSVFPVDEMRALDNTRIFAARSTNISALEKRAEAAADPRFCLNRMVGGEISRLELMLNLSNPRARVLTPSPVAASHDEANDAWDEVENASTQRRVEGYDVVDKLARMDMTIHASARDVGSTHFWSRRDFIGRALALGYLSVEEFAGFLTVMGESIVWPEG
jgi:hypothetical protein